MRISCICGWIEQWKGYDPGFVGAVKLLLPGGAGSSKAPPMSAVTVCATASMLFTVTVAPGLTEWGVVKPKSLMAITAGGEAVVPDPEADDEPDPVAAVAETDAAPADDPLEPHADRAATATAHRGTNTTRRGLRSRTGARVPDMSRHHLCGRC
jgi:hypothetical protein